MRRCLIPLLLLAMFAPALAADEPPKGFVALFNGKNLDGWKATGKMDVWGAENGMIYVAGGGGGWLLTEKEYANYELRLEYKVPKMGNSGVALRSPLQGDPAYVGMCKIPVLDHSLDRSGNSDPRQANGSAYGMVAAHRGYLRAPGQWNFEQVTVKGSTITVELNGTTILEADLSDVTDFLANHPHPGKDRSSGHFGISGHTDPVQFRNIHIKRLP